MDREDSGVIDLFATHARTKALESTAPPPPEPTPSSAPAAVTMNVGGSSELSTLDDDELDVPFANTKSRQKRIFVGLGIAGVLAIIGIVALSGGGGDDGAPKAAAAAAPVAPPPTAPAPPPPPAPPPVVDPAPSPSTIAPSPATAKTRATSKPIVPRGPARPASTGPKLIKVQSSGVP
jgi:hypothetical protein